MSATKKNRKMADIDEQLNRPREGEGLSADVIQEDSSETSEEEE